MKTSALYILTILLLCSFSFAKELSSHLYTRKELFHRDIDSSDIDAILKVRESLPHFREGSFKWDSESKRIISLSLWFRGDDSVTIAPEIGLLSELETINLSHAKNIALPAEFGNLKKLTDLTINHTEMELLPLSIFRCTNLKYLNLSDNQLTQIPDHVRNLQNIRTLNLNNNNLQMLPASLGDLKRGALINLQINNNKLKTIPKEIDSWFNSSQNGLDDSIRKSMYQNPFRLRECPPHFRKALTSAFESQADPFFMLSAHNTFGKPLGYSMSFVMGYGVSSSLSDNKNELSTSHLRQKTVNMYMYKKGFHILVEPGVRGIRFGGGINRLPIPLSLGSQLSLRCTGISFWGKHKKNPEYGSRLYVGPEIGYSFAVSFRVGYLREYKGDRYILSIQGGMAPSFLTLFTAANVLGISSKIKNRRLARKKRWNSRKKKRPIE